MYHIKFSIYIIQYYIYVDKNKHTDTVNCSLFPITKWCVTTCYDVQSTSPHLTLSWSPRLQTKNVGENKNMITNLILICITTISDTGGPLRYAVVIILYTVFIWLLIYMLLWTNPYFNYPPYYSVPFMPVKWEYTVFGIMYTSCLNGLPFDLWSGVMAWLFIIALIVSEWRVLGTTVKWWSNGKGQNYIRTTHGLLFWREKQSLNQ